MFVENTLKEGERRGCIEVICGSMFSGKTEELIRRLKRARIAKLKVEIFKPEVDSRYDESDVVSHDSNAIHSTAVPNSGAILLLADQVDVVGIDEVQFFDDQLIHVCNMLANRGIRVICAGLDMDYSGRPFGVMPGLMAVAEYVTKVHAICVDCGHIANHSYRMVADQKLVMLGETDSYQALCRDCFKKKTKLK
ncbi:MAG: thymidine kinase [Bacteroidetes bacterium]|jgi:thymidine kinase|nr:thymidine kinase [Bacteroidota bacterium]